MQIPDIWSLLTGMASFVSLFLSVGERFARWRKYSLPVAAGLGGFAVGRISPSLLSGMDHLFSDPKATGFILLVFMIFAALILVAYLLMRHGQVMLAYFVFGMGIISVPTSIIPMYSKMIESVPPGDLVKLAQVKVTAGEYEQAIKYLESAKDKTKNDVFKKELQAQIDMLIRRSAKISVEGQTK